MTDLFFPLYGSKMALCFLISSKSNLLGRIKSIFDFIQSLCHLKIIYDSNYYYYYFILCEFLTLALADGLPLEKKWWQVSSDLQVFSLYSNSGLVGLNSSSGFQILQSFFPSLWELLQEHQQQSVLPLSSCSTAFSALWQGQSICPFYCFLVPLWFTRIPKSSRS